MVGICSPSQVVYITNHNYKVIGNVFFVRQKAGFRRSGWFS